MQKIVAGIIFILITALAVVQGQDKAGKAAPKSGAATTLIGEVIDLACYVGHNMSGKDHADCAKTCAEKGLPLAILDQKTQQIYLPLGLDHSNPNTKLMKYIGQPVKVTGQVWTKGGLTGIDIKTVEAAAAKGRK